MGTAYEKRHVVGEFTAMKHMGAQQWLGLANLLAWQCPLLQPQFLRASPA